MSENAAFNLVLNKMHVCIFQTGWFAFQMRLITCICMHQTPTAALNLSTAVAKPQVACLVNEGKTQELFRRDRRFNTFGSFGPWVDAWLKSPGTVVIATSPLTSNCEKCEVTTEMLRGEHRCLWFVIKRTSWERTVQAAEFICVFITGLLSSLFKIFHIYRRPRVQFSKCIQKTMWIWAEAEGPASFHVCEIMEAHDSEFGEISGSGSDIKGGMWTHYSRSCSKKLRSFAV